MSLTDRLLGDRQRLAYIASQAADSRLNVELETEGMTLNIGPQHPATHGTLRIIARLDGEPVMVMGTGSKYARQDDFWTDFRALDGKTVRMADYAPQTLDRHSLTVALVSDLRAGLAYVMAAALAKGETTITSIPAAWACASASCAIAPQSTVTMRLDPSSPSFTSAAPLGPYPSSRRSGM